MSSLGDTNTEELSKQQRHFRRTHTYISDSLNHTLLNTHMKVRTLNAHMEADLACESA